MTFEKNRRHGTHEQTDGRGVALNGPLGAPHNGGYNRL